MRPFQMVDLMRRPFHIRRTFPMRRPPGDTPQKTGVSAARRRNGGKNAAPIAGFGSALELRATPIVAAFESSRSRLSAGVPRQTNLMLENRDELRDLFKLRNINEKIFLHCVAI